MRAFLKVLFASLLVVIPVKTALADGLPKAVIDEHVYQAGTIPQGQQIVHDFIIKNGGESPLTIKAQPC
jgi:hypothetical protein